MAQREAFPWVMIGMCVVAVAWHFGHPWWGVLLLLVPPLLLMAPVLLGMLSIAVLMLVAAVAYLPVLIVRCFRALSVRSA